MNDLSICENVSLLEILEHINKTGEGFVCLSGDSGITGLLTDGDIRRALIAGANLSEKAAKYCVGKFIYADSTIEALRLFDEVSEDVKFIPIIDKNNNVVEVVKRESIAKYPVAAPTLKKNEFKYLVDAFLSNWISSLGDYIGVFEKKFSEFIGMDIGISCSNGTSALHLALMALEVGPGDEVIVPNLTFAATINAVLHAGATPVIVDIEPDFWGMDPEKLLQNISAKTKAVIAVHLYGQPCKINEIKSICDKHDLKLIEDCAEAHGASVNGKKVGTFGDVSCFSFYANKIITTGEGGMCLTNDSNLAQKMATLRDHGMDKNRRYWHSCVGYNYRMTNLQAAIGVAQVEDILKILSRRQEIADMYRQSKLNKFVEFIDYDIDKIGKVVWLVSGLVRTAELKASVIEKLSKIGVETRPFFHCLDEMDIYMNYRGRGGLECSRNISSQGISFPTYDDLEKLKEIQKLLSKFE